MAEINGINVPFVPAGGQHELQKKPVPAETRGASFKDIFQAELGKLKFSGHAQARMASREINISDADMIRLENAVSKAELKGANETLVLMNDRSFIVSVPNRTVITMFNNEQLEDNVITDIDSAVFA